MHHIEAHVAWTTSTKHGIEVGTIVIHQTTTVVNQLGNLRNTSFKQSEGIRIGHHHSGNLSSLLSYQALQILEINLTISQRFHLNNLQATHSGRGRIGTMGAIGHNHLFARHITTTTMIIVDSHQSR